MNATVEQLEAVFNNFGPIKHNGIQVRSSKQQGTCFGFVEFESASSMQSAIELTMTEGGFQDGLVIKMITLGAVETSVVGILAEAVAMGEMTLRGEVISQIKLTVMLDGMKKLSIGSTIIKMITLGAVETSVVGILAEAVAMGEMTLRGEVISQIELTVMLDGMKKLSIGSTKMV
ncbi:uncharacterized protein LOC111992640 [Quercus suber]|uniref:uncharacterized protein LOC111992640 n=1 Tax=Quercus suber TaxID=58331 RepID=UPI000CE1EF56|nr:uncharacterized protein LOC111992640 [Quercus suber]